MGPSPYVDPLLVQQNLTEDEILLRREFARLFVDHHNAYDACRELGFTQPYCADWARTFMDCAVTRHFIKEEKALRYSEDSLKDARSLVLRKLAELGDYSGPGSSHGARVTAWVAYGKYAGVEPVSESKTELAWKGGVMMVPALTSPDEWGNLAAKSQADLKQTVKD